MELTLAEELTLQEYAHARHIRFGDHHALLLDKGLAMFDEPHISQATPCSYGDARAARMRETEVIARSHPNARYLDIA